jgi:hypothetical protein
MSKRATLAVLHTNEVPEGRLDDDAAAFAASCLTPADKHPIAGMDELLGIERELVEGLDPLKAELKQTLWSRICDRVRQRSKREGCQEPALPRFARSDDRKPADVVTRVRRDARLRPLSSAGLRSEGSDRVRAVW